jgi:molybdopterin molybdotransferase
MGLVPLTEARRHVLERCGVLGVASTPIDQALGAVTAEPVIAAEQVPPFDNTAMDGYAVRASDVAGASPERPVRLQVVDTLAAGRAPEIPVGEGQAVRIMTGAPMPAGADAVVMVERTSTVDDRWEVDVAAEVAPGTNVRRAGEDVRRGDEVVAAGVELTPAHLGVLANLGATAVLVHRRARVGVISTGDELVSDGGDLRAGQIRDSNRPALLAALRDARVDAVDLGRVPDDEGAITTALTRGATECDAVVSSGGVSMGDVDLVKVVLDRLGEMRWMQVAIKPAKPFAFGTISSGSDRSVPVFGLPGNPVSSLVSFELFARPALRRMMGHTVIDRPCVRAVADERLARRPDGKVHFARVGCHYAGDGLFHVRSAGGQGSHQLRAMADANALAVLPDGDAIEIGDVVEVLLLGEPALVPARDPLGTYT